MGIYLCIYPVCKGGTPILPTPILPIPISPTPISPTLKFEIIPISPTLDFCAMHYGVMVKHAIFSVVV